MTAFKIRGCILYKLSATNITNRPPVAIQTKYYKRGTMQTEYYKRAVDRDPNQGRFVNNLPQWTRPLGDAAAPAAGGC
jgi:hypothetical protein